MINKNKQTQNSSIYLLLLGLIIIWGLSWPVSKIGLRYMPPLWFAAMRLSLGTVTMFFVVTCLGKFVWPRKEDLKIIFIIGFLQIGLFMTLVNIGLFHVDAGRSAILVYTTPLWVVPISVIFFKDHPSWKKWLGCGLGFIGILVLFNPLKVNWSDHQAMFGNCILLAAALCWAIAILCARHMRWARRPIELISWQLLVGTIPVIVYALYKNPQAHIIWDNTLLFSLIYSGVLATAFGYWGTVVISKELPPITTSLSLLAIPVIGLISSAFMLHETITLTLIVAMIFILLGLLCVITDRK